MRSFTSNRKDEKQNYYIFYNILVSFIFSVGVIITKKQCYLIAKNDINMNNLINYDNESIQEFRRLLFKCKLKHIIIDEHYEEFS